MYVCIYVAEIAMEWCCNSVLLVYTLYFICVILFILYLLAIIDNFLYYLYFGYTQVRSN